MMKERTIFIGRLKERERLELVEAGIPAPEGLTFTVGRGQIDTSKYAEGDIYYTAEEALEGLCKALKEGGSFRLKYAESLAEALLAAERMEDSAFEGGGEELEAEELPY